MRAKFSRSFPTFYIEKYGRPFLVLLTLCLSFSMFGQVDLSDGQQAIEEAATGIEDYFEPIRNVVVRLVIL